MTNPPPRPALRKAHDHDVHPAVGPALTPAVEVVAPIGGPTRVPPHTSAPGTLAHATDGRGAAEPAGLPTQPAPPPGGPPAPPRADAPTVTVVPPPEATRRVKRPGATSDTLRPVRVARVAERTKKKDKKGKKKGKGRERSHLGAVVDAASAPAPSQPTVAAAPVALVLSLEAGLAARLDARAAEHGLRREQAVEQLLRAWVDG